MTVRDTRGAMALLGVGYALAYLYLLGDLDRAPGAGWSITLGDPGAWLDRRGLMQFEPIALLELGPVLWLFSPTNALLAAVLGALLALNLDGAWQLWRQPAACAMRSGQRDVSLGTGSGGVLAAFPALFAGGACCAPSILLLLGMPSLGAFAGLFAWLVPVSLALLVASRFWQRHRGAPAFVR